MVSDFDAWVEVEKWQKEVMKWTNYDPKTPQDFEKNISALEASKANLAVAFKLLNLGPDGQELRLKEVAQEHAAPDPQASTPATGDLLNLKISAPDWRMRVQAEAYERWLRLRAAGCNPSVFSICEDMARWCIEQNIKGGKGQNPRGGTIRNTVLGAGHWTPPSHSVKEARDYIARTAQTQVAQIKK